MSTPKKAAKAEPKGASKADRNGMRAHDENGNVRPADGRWPLHHPSEESEVVTTDAHPTES